MLQAARWEDYLPVLPQQQLVQVQVQAAENSDSGAMAMESNSRVLVISMLSVLMIISVHYLLVVVFAFRIKTTRSTVPPMHAAKQGETGLQNAKKQGTGG